MNPDVESMLEQAEDPRVIRGIYNYCHRWCERCPFTERCAVFRENRRFETEHPERSPFEHVHASFQQMIELLKAWCAREGVDFAQIAQEAKSDAAVTDQRLNDEAVIAEPLSKLAKAYLAASWEVVRAIERTPHFNDLEAQAHDAVETIRWYAAFIGAKIDRAVHGARESVNDGFEEDAIQNDWNGSAKTARMAIEASRRAWLIVLEAGQAPSQSPLREMVDVLNSLDSGVADRFPDAMRFVRPGFDEPEVAAGAWSSLDCFDPRP